MKQYQYIVKYCYPDNDGKFDINAGNIMEAVQKAMSKLGKYGWILKIEQLPEV